ncbi:MAG: DNA polymerase domain-containing protein [Nanopusillaceae archaeon]
MRTFEDIINKYLNDELSEEDIKAFYLNLNPDERKSFDNVINTMITRYKNLQETMKLIMNSVYGYTGYKNSIFFNKYIAESITQIGAEILQSVMKILNENNIYVIYGDTDSMFLQFNLDIERYKENGRVVLTKERKMEIVEKIHNELSKVKEIIKDFLERYYEERTHFHTHLDNKNVFDFKTEMIASKMFLLESKKGDVAKKKYIIDVIENEGVIFENGKLDFRGIDVRKKDISKEVKELILRIINFINDYYDGKIERKEDILDLHNENIEIIKGWIDNFEFKKFAEIKNVSKSLDEYKNNNLQVQAVKLYNTIFTHYNLPEIQGFMKVYIVYIRPSLVNIIKDEEKLDIRDLKFLKNVKAVAIPSEIVIPNSILKEVFEKYLIINKDEIIKKVYSGRVETLINTFLKN